MLKKLYTYFLYLVEELIPMITLAITVISLILQVFFRYILNISLEWPFELSIYAFVWTLYLGAAYARREGKHVKLDIVYERMPKKVRAVFNIIFNVIVILIFSRILYPIWDYLLFSYRIKTVALKLPWTYVFAAFPVFLLLTIVHNIEYIIKDIKLLFQKENNLKEG